MTFGEVLQNYILPAGGVLGGLTTLIVFLLSRSQRMAERKKIEAEVREILGKSDLARAGELSDLQSTWHKEFARLTKKIEALEREKRGQDLTIGELTAENVELKKTQAAQEIDLREKEETIKKLERRILALEKLLKKAGIDPDGE